MKKKNIRIYDLAFEARYRKQFNKGVKKILDEGFLSNHTFVNKLETKFSKKNNSKYSVAVNSGTAAIELILRSIKIKNKKVLIGNNTFIATAVAVKNSGGIPLPVDIDGKYFSLCPRELERAIKKNKNIGAVIIIHIAGLVTPNIYKIVSICKKYNIPLVEDCAQAFGSTMKNKNVGNFGIAGAFSLQTTKVLTAGEGGIVVTNDKNLFEQMSKNKFYGYSKDNKLLHVTEGSNLKMSEFVALAAICDLERVDSRVKKRQNLAHRYQKNLKNTVWKTLAPVKNSTSSYYKQIILSPIKRKIIYEKFSRYSVSPTGGVYFEPLNRQPILGKLSDKLFPNSSYFADNHFCPPCYPELSLSDIDYICNILQKIT